MEQKAAVKRVADFVVVTLFVLAIMGGCGKAKKPESTPKPQEKQQMKEMMQKQMQQQGR